MPDNSYGKTFNGMYIDTIYIDNNSSTTMTSSDGYNTTDGNATDTKTQDSPNIVKLYEAFESENYVYLVMEYVSGGSLHGYLKQR